jgi:PAS domain S-box-containing protein
MQSAPSSAAVVPGNRPLNRATAAAAVIAAVIFLLDVRTPHGYGVGTLYVVPLLVATLNGPPRFQLAAASIASVLTVAGAWAAPPGVEIGYVVANRGMALLVIWTTAVVLGRFRETWLGLQARTKDLHDVKFALDQSAIVATTDTRGRIKSVNDKFCQVSKYPREELLGKDHRILNSGYHPKEFIRTLWSTIQSGRIWRGEIRNRAKDGSLYWVDTTIVPFLDTDGKPYQYMAIRYEVTDRKRTEDKLREQEALARLGQMAAVVAHEVKNPIAGIRGALQVIASRMPAESRDKPVMGDIIARLDALNGIVHDLLVFARPRAIRTEPVQLRLLISSTVDLLRRDPAHAALEVDVVGDNAVVSGDAEQLQLAFQNILLNAAQAMAGAGHIAVRIDRSNGECAVAVSDEGPGMPAEVREKVFEPFFTTKHRGTGLGLPIARRVVEAHGGRIDIEVPPSGGTVVTVRIPATR